MVLYSLHVSDFLRRDQGYDLGLVNNLFAYYTTSNGSVRLFDLLDKRLLPLRGHVTNASFNPRTYKGVGGGG